MYGVAADVESPGVRDYRCPHSPSCALVQRRTTQQQQQLSPSDPPNVLPLSTPLTINHSSLSPLSSPTFSLNMASTSITPTQQMLASCSGALITSALVTPFDVIKIRIQSAAAAAASASASYQCPKCMVYFNGLMDHVCSASCKPFLPRPAYQLNGQSSSFFKSLLKIVRHEGPFVLWSGLPPTLLMAIPSTVIYFTAYDNLRTLLGFDTSSSSSSSDWRQFAIPFVSGAAARFAAVTVISPLELVRTKMQSASMSYDQIGSAVKDAVTRGGWRSLWAGWAPSIWRDVPFSGVYFCGYELAKRYYSKMMEKEEETIGPGNTAVSASSSSSNAVKINFLSGATSAFFATVLTQPFDVLKTRTQIRLGEANFVVNGAASSSSESVWRSAAGVVRVHGYAGLYAGVVPRLMKVIPACAIMITSYEYFKEVFAARNSRRRTEDL